MRAEWRERLRIILFEVETPAGKFFDVALLWCILLSVAAVIFESVTSIRTRYGSALRALEWVFTAIFTVEYLLRLVCVLHPSRYARSFYGVVDLLAIIPTYLSLLIPGSHSLLVLRALRLLRVFRVLKLAALLGEATVLMTALRASRNKIFVFLGTVMVLVLILGTSMYLIEGADHGFTSIPQSMYWAVVTMTTVGYGDITPQTVIGKGLASFVMVLGYGIIAIPTGIVSAELVQAGQRPITTRICPGCMTEGHAFDALFCQDCGGELPARPAR